MFFSLKYILSNSRSLEAERTQTWFSYHYFSLILSKAGMSMNFCDDACCTCISYCSLAVTKGLIRSNLREDMVVGESQSCCSKV